MPALQAAAASSGCVQDSIFVVKYKRSENVFYCAADEAEPRHTTAALTLDYDTVAGADKFGNVYVLRLPTDTSAEVCAQAEPDWCIVYPAAHCVGSTGQDCSTYRSCKQCMRDH